MKRNVYSHEVWPEVMNDGAEGEPVPPGGRHIGHLDPSVSLGDLLAPLQQVLCGCPGGARGHSSL